MNLKQKPQQGFTLIELIVVIFIIGTISSISIANFRSGERQKRVVIASDTVINAIRNAQNFTLSGRATNNASAACRVPQYYYVRFTYPAGVVLFAVNNCGGSPDQIESYSLPAKTRIKALGMNIGGIAATTNMTFAFYPPFANLKAAKDSGAYDIFSTAAITVETDDGAISKTVNVDGVAGRIGE